MLIEIAMKDDAIIPIRLFHSNTFSMATIIGVLVGFGMFGAMMTIPLYMQIVAGLTPTESGLAMLPMVIGLMTSSMAAGQITSRTGKYGIFPRTGTLTTALGFLLLTFVSSSTPVWYMMIGMFVVGLGLGQLMQSLTMASQNSVAAPDMGVATSAATFFRQIGGTLGTAIMLSILFTLLPLNITHSMADKPTLTAALNAALDPAVAGKEQNKAVMKQLWSPIVGPLQTNIQSRLDKGTAAAKAAADKAVTEKVTAGVEQAVAAGQVPAAAAQSVIDQQVAEATPAAEAAALQAVADKAHATVKDGAVVVDWSDQAQRGTGSTSSCRDHQAARQGVVQGIERIEQHGQRHLVPERRRLRTHQAVHGRLHEGDRRHLLGRLRRAHARVRAEPVLQGSAAAHALRPAGAGRRCGLQRDRKHQDAAGLSGRPGRDASRPGRRTAPVRST